MVVGLLDGNWIVVVTLGSPVSNIGKQYLYW